MEGEEDGKAKVKKASLEKAIRALLQIVAKQTANANQLFDSNAEAMKIVFSLSNIPEKRKDRPYMIALPHPMFDEKSEICFISKSPQKEYKELLLKTHPVPGVTKVIGVEKLRKYYTDNRTKTALADAFDLFLCDRDVVEMMRKILGNVFYKQRCKPPIPVILKKSDPVPKLQFAINATPLRVPTGPTLQVRIGRCSMSQEHLIENAAKVIPTVLKYFSDNPVQSIHVQVSNSPALPIWRRPSPPGAPIDLKKYREDATSSAASDTGASRESDSEATHKSSVLSESGDTLSTKDTISEPPSPGDLLSDLDTIGETSSELGSDAADLDDAVLPTESLPLLQGLKKKKRRHAGDAPVAAKGSATAAAEPAAASTDTPMGPPSKKAKKAKAQ